jgi:SAM-dependent methyltransferase
MNEKHEANRRRWNAASPSYAAMAERSGSWRKAAQNPAWAFLPRELAILGAVAGKRACVLGSGDNLAVFALAGLGAEVTSVDISEKQLDVARTRAEALGLAVRFVRADVTRLEALRDAEFDLVHTGRHVAVWVTDLRAYYREAVRILAPGGLFLVTEYHPFRRIFRDDRSALAVAASYLERGPFCRAAPDGLFDPGPGPHASYESHWTVADFYNAVVEAGCEVTAFDELGDEPEGWEAAPLAGLPQLLLIAARKRTTP